MPNKGCIFYCAITYRGQTVKINKIIIIQFYNFNALQEIPPLDIWTDETDLLTDVVSWNAAKNYIGCYAGGTFDVCGDYASDSLTPEICTTCCGLAGYRYSALRNGEQCLCSNTVDSNKRVGDPRCDDPCTGNIVLRCGGRDAYSIYEALGDYSFPFELTMPKNVSVYERINANFTSYSGASYTLDFGEDVVFNSDNASVSYLYHSTGQHNVYGHALLGEYGEAQMKSTSLAVSCLIPLLSSPPPFLLFSR